MTSEDHAWLGCFGLNLGHAEKIGTSTSFAGIPQEEYIIVYEVFSVH